MSIAVTKSNIEQKKKEAAKNTYIAYEIGEYYYSFSNYKEAFKWYEKAGTGTPAVPMALYAMGYAYQNGEGTEVDLFKAFQYYEAAAQKDLPQACYNVAYFYQNGIGVSRDINKANWYSERAAESLKRLVDDSQEAKEHVNQINAQYSQILTSVQMMERDLVAVSNESANKSKKIGELEAAAADCKKIVSKLTEEIQVKDNALALQKERCVKTESLQHDLLRMVEALNGDIRTLQNQIDELKQQCSDEISKNAYLEGEKMQLQEDKSNLLRAREAYHGELVSADKQIVFLNNSIATIQSAKESMEAEMQTCRAELKKVSVQRNIFVLISLVVTAIGIATYFL